MHLETRLDLVQIIVRRRVEKLDADETLVLLPKHEDEAPRPGPSLDSRRGPARVSARKGLDGSWT
jgi:hypothetical protein